MNASGSSTGAALQDWLHFILSPGVSRPAQRALLRAYGSPGAALAAPRAESARWLEPDAAEAWRRGPDRAAVDRSLRWLESAPGHLLALGDAAYPQALLETPDPPTALFVRGRLDLLNATALAVVGSRNATPLGMRDAEQLARALSEAGLTVVSGLALGIDAAAHRGGLAARSSSVAVMGTGPERIYPSANLELGERLAAEGALVSEFAPGMPPRAENFPCRNRILSGLARGVLVVEAAPRSGSLITARCALEQGREVFAVPGSIHAPLARGCHALIRQGAKLVECVDDILTELSLPLPAAARQEATRNDDPLLSCLGFAPASIDELSARMGRNAAQLAARLAELQIEGRVALLPGGRFQRITMR